ASSLYQHELPQVWGLLLLIHLKLVTVFEACDEDNKGCLSREDLKVAVAMFGYKPSKVEVDLVMSSVILQNSVNMQTFLNLMSEKKDAQLYSNETRQRFIAFDVQDGGFSTFEDFKRACNSFSPKLPEKIIVEAFRSLKLFDFTFSSCNQEINIQELSLEKFS
uniref:EF-hand calcium binding domain 11 n=1 Tax=Falco tinnunculus TaxID=100819 RepID=A0A8C4UTG9_FALTI